MTCPNSGTRRRRGGSNSYEAGSPPHAVFGTGAVANPRLAPPESRAAPEGPGQRTLGGIRTRIPGSSGRCLCQLGYERSKEPPPGADPGHPPYEGGVTSRVRRQRSLARIRTSIARFRAACPAVGRPGNERAQKEPAQMFSAVDFSTRVPPPAEKGSKSMGGRSRTRFPPVLETGRLSVGSPIEKAAWGRCPQAALDRA